MYQVIHPNGQDLTGVDEGVVKRALGAGLVLGFTARGCDTRDVFCFTGRDRDVTDADAAHLELQVIVAQVIVLLNALNLDFGDVSHVGSIASFEGIVAANVPMFLNFSMHAIGFSTQGSAVGAFTSIAASRGCGGLRATGA
jgi:hypothetical protein